MSRPSTIDGKNKSRFVIFRFRIQLHIDDIATLQLIRNTLGVGVVKPEGNSCIYIVSSVSDLVNVILPIFTSFPLLSSKKLDLSDFVAAINLKLPYASSLPVNVYNHILNLKKSMNTGRTTYMSPTIVNYDSIDKF